MYSYAERMEKIINIIRSREGWEPNHRNMTFGDFVIGYYDTEGKGDYFHLKYNGADISHQSTDSIALAFKTWDLYNNFNFDKWLSEIEKHVTEKTIILDGKEYILTERS